MKRTQPIATVEVALSRSRLRKKERLLTAPKAQKTHSLRDTATPSSTWKACEISSMHWKPILWVSNPLT